MNTTFAPTGSTLGDYEKLTILDERSNSTNIKDSNNPVLREILIGFQEAFREPLALLRGFTRQLTAVGFTWEEEEGGTCRREHIPSHISVLINDNTLFPVVTFYKPLQISEATHRLHYHSSQLTAISDTINAAETIDAIVKLVKLPNKDVLAAAGVKKSTFYSWKQSKVPMPRLASQGRLWELAQFVEDLTELLGGPIGPWLLAEQIRRRLFITGRFDQLLEMLRSQPRKRVSAPEYATLAAIGGDPLANNDNEAEPRRKPRGRMGSVQSVRGTNRSRGSRREL